MSERQEPSDMSINLAEWQKRRLDELARTTGLSYEQLASEILEFILSGDASIVELISRFGVPAGGNGCPEECVDVGQAWKFVDGECPEPCDEDVLADLDRLARGDARRHAMEKCLQANPDCLCVEGTYKLLEEKCETRPKDREGNKWCYYLVRYEYKGKCKKETEVEDATDEDVKCPEECKGEGWASKDVEGECPDTWGDATVFNELTPRAKSMARQRSMNKCARHHPNCICKDGTYKILEKKCETKEMGDRKKYCRYVLRYEYVGKCKNVP